jgi:hypothetical protein
MDRLALFEFQTTITKLKMREVVDLDAMDTPNEVNIEPESKVSEIVIDEPFDVVENDLILQEKFDNEVGKESTSSSSSSDEDLDINEGEEDAEAVEFSMELEPTQSQFRDRESALSSSASASSGSDVEGYERSEESSQITLSSDGDEGDDESDCSENEETAAKVRNLVLDDIILDEKFGVDDEEGIDERSSNEAATQISSDSDAMDVVEDVTPTRLTYEVDPESGVPESQLVGTEEVETEASGAMEVDFLADKIIPLPQYESATQTGEEGDEKRKGVKRNRQSAINPPVRSDRVLRTRGEKPSGLDPLFFNSMIIPDNILGLESDPELMRAAQLLLSQSGLGAVGDLRASQTTALEGATNTNDGSNVIVLGATPAFSVAASVGSPAKQTTPRKGIRPADKAKSTALQHRFFDSINPGDVRKFSSSSLSVRFVCLFVICLFLLVCLWKMLLLVGCCCLFFNVIILLTAIARLFGLSFFALPVLL